MVKDLYDTDLYKDALSFHSAEPKGKISITHKALSTTRDLTLAYTPGVAAPCKEIEKDPAMSYEYTAKGNMVAIITNGTAVLGLGNIGAAASKPVMEGKAVLFKRFAKIDAIDVEVNTEDPDKFIEVVSNIGESWGGVNLEDIKAPECFRIEKELEKMLSVPVFHDDQHGTAVVTLAGLINGAHITDKDPRQMKIVVNGAGAAALSCVELMRQYGVPRDNITMCDLRGVLYKGRKILHESKENYASDTKARTLKEALKGADMLLGLSARDAVKPDDISAMAKNPLIFVLANPIPEILPEVAMKERPDAVIATGRSDYPNQINNVMCFPYIFRGALDVRARNINTEMKMAASQAIAMLARKTVPEEVYQAYGGLGGNREKKQYGKNYILPSPFDPRLLPEVSRAVAQAAVDSDVASIKPDLGKLYV